ncbi:hypothetical protein ILYODFUR_039234 [Ilyodon furcidens]|uniref:Uncharacterized protein n=1 Tax=Ilyodon furcidens TaxID=33524 RepID=A0ABV0UPL3_9TELE
MTTSPQFFRSSICFVPQRIHFKVLTHKALHNRAPYYLTNLLHPHSPSRSLHFSDANLLSPPGGSVTGPGVTEPPPQLLPPSGTLSPNTSVIVQIYPHSNQISKLTFSEQLLMYD